MRVIDISNKVYLVRHWFKWYRVQRGASQWQPLAPFIQGDKTPPSKPTASPIDTMSPAEATKELERRTTR